MFIVLTLHFLIVEERLGLLVQFTGPGVIGLELSIGHSNLSGTSTDECNIVGVGNSLVELKIVIVFRSVHALIIILTLGLSLLE